jgi:hypothetical protein
MLQNSLLQNVNYKIEYFEQTASVLIPWLQVNFQFKNFQFKSHPKIAISDLIEW